MNELFLRLALLLGVLWPLFLAATVVFGTTRSAALYLTPWASLPALILAVFLPDTVFPLPGVILGSVLALDKTGRIFLLLSTILWLAAGFLVRSRLQNPGGTRFAVLFLLFMGGGFGLTLAGDALLFFAAGTLAGFSLYGLLNQDSNVEGKTAGRTLVVLLVSSDLLVFELLFMAGKVSEGLDFVSLRQTLLNTEKWGVMLCLLIIGFGVKTGVVSVHFWLSPAFGSSIKGVRLAVVGFMFNAGLLGWLRLIPFEEIPWTGGSIVFQYLAWFTLGYALLVGLLQPHFLSKMTYAAMVLTGMWFAVLGSVLRYPQAMKGVDEAVAVVVPQSGLALSGLLLVGWWGEWNFKGWLRLLFQTVRWLSVFLLAASPLGFMDFLEKVDPIASMQLSLVVVSLGLLASRALLQNSSGNHYPQTMKPSHEIGRKPPEISTAMPLLAAGGLTGVGLLVGKYNLVELFTTKIWLTGLVVLGAVLAARLKLERLPRYLPILKPETLPILMGNALGGVLNRSRDLAYVRFPVWRGVAISLVQRLWLGVNCRQILGRFEYGFNQWPTALVFLALLGWVLAVLSAME